MQANKLANKSLLNEIFLFANKQEGSWTAKLSSAKKTSELIAYIY